MLRQATARISHADTPSWGTAWSISPSIVITAAHCLGNTSKGGQVTLTFPDETADGEVLWEDPSLDAAVIILKRPRAHSNSPINISRLANLRTPEMTWAAFGFPDAYHEGLTITGNIVSLDGRLDGRRVIELSCFQGVDSEALSGMSGGAVTVNNRCIGIVVFAPPALQQRVMFAVPIEEIADAVIQSRLLESNAEAQLFRSVELLEIDSYDVAMSQYLDCVRVSTGRLPRSAMWLSSSMTQSPPRTCDIMIPLNFRPIIGKTISNNNSTDSIRCDLATGETYPLVALEHAIRARLESSLVHLFFFGDPGSGKSFLLRYIASRAWDDPVALGFDCTYIPMIIRLRNLPEDSTNLEEWLWHAMFRGTDVRLCKKPPSGFFEEWPRRSGAKWLILLDGFDEVPTRLRSSVLDRIGLVLDSTEYVCLLTSRPAQGSSDPVLYLCNTCACFEIQPVTEDQETMLAEKWLGSDAPRFIKEFRKMRLNGKRITPLLITIAAGVYKCGTSLPDSRVGLYDALVKASITEAKMRGLEGEVGARLASLVRPLLETLALACVEDRSSRSLEGMINSCRSFLQSTLGVSKQEASVEGHRVVMALGRLSGLFFCDERSFSWWHPTLQEYLAAGCLAREASRDRLHQICSGWSTEAWNSVVLFLFSLLAIDGDRTKVEAQSLSTELAQLIIDDEAKRHSEGRESAMDGDLESFGGAGLFLSAALVEGAIFEPSLTSTLIRYLQKSCEHAGQFDFCREVYDQLSNSGRSPVELLGQLAFLPTARAALINVLKNDKLQKWVYESAALACVRSGMADELWRLTGASQVGDESRAAISHILASSQAKLEA